MSARLTSPRRLALEALRRIRRGELSDRVARELFTPLERRDRAWALELLYGTLRLRGRLDHFLAARLRQAPDELEPDVLDVLRLGAFQLLEMDSVPSYAAISQSQELARAAGVGRAAGLIAGVLHSLAREPAVAFPDPDTDPIGHLTTWGSHPRWLVERWIRRWGPTEAAALVEANNRRPELFIRPIGMEISAAVEGLRAAGIEAEPVPISPRSLRILTSTPVPAVLAAVPAIVQDPAAALVVDYAAVAEGAHCLDLCAAPGGKTIAIAERAAFVAAADVSPARLGMVRENVRRLGLESRVGLLAADGRIPPFGANRSEFVLLDAPCTGTGTFRRHTDGRWRIQPEDLATLRSLQSELLHAAAHLVAPGGVLVYSTCAVEEEENELQIEGFLAEHSDWAVEPVAGSVPTEVTGADGMLRVLPQRLNVDGAFAARLRRAA